jgi:hypothetical protein
VGYELMVGEPEIVKELRKEEKLGQFGSQSQGLDEELDDMWFNIWKCL